MEVEGKHAAELAGQDLGIALAHAGIVTPAIAVLQGEAFLLREARGLHHGFHSRHVHGHRFLRENMFPRLDRRAHMLRAEAGRCGQQHDIHAALEHFHVGIQARKLPFLRDIQPALEPFQVVERLGNLRLEQIADRPEHGVVIRHKGLLRRAGAPSAAANEADLELRIGGGCAEEDVRESGKGGGSSGGLEKCTAVGRFHQDSFTAETMPGLQ